MADLVAYAKANPDKANYSCSSAAFQLATELFKQKTGVPMQMIPYKGANDSVTAVISGEVTATIADAGPVTSQVNGGNARALAVAAPKRAESLPDVPTMKEAGADVEAVLWSGIFVPAATPSEIVASWRLNSSALRGCQTLSPASNCSISIRSAIPRRNFRASSRPTLSAGRRSRATAISRWPSRSVCVS